MDASYCIVQCHDHYDSNPRYNAGNERLHLVVYLVSNQHDDALCHHASRALSSRTNNTLSDDIDLDGMRSRISLPVLADLTDLHMDFPPDPPDLPEGQISRNWPAAPRCRGKDVSAYSLLGLFDDLLTPSASQRERIYTSDMLDGLRLESMAQERLSVWLQAEGFRLRASRARSDRDKSLLPS